MPALGYKYKKFTAADLERALTMMSSIQVKDPTRTFVIQTGIQGQRMINAAIEREARLALIASSLNTLHCKRAITKDEHAQFKAMLVSEDPDAFDLAEALIEAKLKTL